MATARCFVAVRLGADIERQLGRVCQRLARHGGGVRWVEPANMHLTLKFLGDVEGARLGEVVEALREVEVDGPLQLSLSGLGVFPPRGAPRVLWAGLAGDVARLTELAGRIDRRLAGLGFAVERRPFRAHLTIGRVKNPRGPGPLVAELPRQQIASDPVTIQSFFLYQSELAPEGPTYTTLESFALA